MALYITLYTSHRCVPVCVWERERNNQQADHSCTSFSPYRSFVYVISARSAIYTQSLAIAAMAPCCCENICHSIHPQYYSSLERPNFAQQQQRPNPAGRRMCSRSCTKYQQPIVIRGGSSLPFLFAKKEVLYHFQKKTLTRRQAGPNWFGAGAAGMFSIRRTKTIETSRVVEVDLYIYLIILVDTLEPS